MNTPLERKPPPAILFWIAWFAVTAGLVVIYLVLNAPATPAVGVVRYVPIIPLVLSSIVRWLVLPRFPDTLPVFPLFVVGLSLAEGCGIIGIVLVSDLRSEYLALGLLGVAQYIPVFVSQPKG